MKIFLVFLFFLVVSAIAFTAKKNKKPSVVTSKRSDLLAPFPFQLKPPLSQPEQVLFFRLSQALPECIVLAQVQLSRFLEPKKGQDQRYWNNRINRMSVDYLVCLKDFTVVAAVELDDKSHSRFDRVQADSKKDKVLSDAGVVLIRWNVSTIPSVDEIRKKFTQ